MKHYALHIAGEIQKYIKETVLPPSLSGAQWEILGKYLLTADEKSIKFLPINKIRNFQENYDQKWQNIFRKRKKN